MTTQTIITSFIAMEDVTIERFDSNSIVFSIKEMYYNIHFDEKTITISDFETDKVIFITPTTGVSSPITGQDVPVLRAAIEGIRLRYNEQSKLHHALFECIKSNRVHKIIAMSLNPKISVQEVIDYINNLPKSDFLK